MEIVVAKGEFDHHEQYLLLQQCFQKLSAAEASESICMRERVKLYFFFFFFPEFPYELSSESIIDHTLNWVKD